MSNKQIVHLETLRPGRAPTGEPIWWLGYNSPIDRQMSRGLDENGDPVVERLPCLVSMVMLDKNGNYKHVAIANARGQRTATINGKARLEQKIKKGFLPYYACPVVSGRCPKAFLHINNPDGLKEGVPCPNYGTRDNASNPGTVDDRTDNRVPCAHIVAIRDFRLKRSRAAYDKMMANTATDRDLLQQALLGAINDRNNRAPEEFEGTKRPRRPTKDAE